MPRPQGLAARSARCARLAGEGNGQAWVAVLWVVGRQRTGKHCLRSWASQGCSEQGCDAEPHLSYQHKLLHPTFWPSTQPKQHAPPTRAHLNRADCSTQAFSVRKACICARSPSCPASCSSRCAALSSSGSCNTQEAEGAIVGVMQVGDRSARSLFQSSDGCLSLFLYDSRHNNTHHHQQPTFHSATAAKSAFSSTGCAFGRSASVSSPLQGGRACLPRSACREVPLASIRSNEVKRWQHQAASQS